MKKRTRQNGFGEDLPAFMRAQPHHNAPLEANSKPMEMRYGTVVKQPPEKDI